MRDAEAQVSLNELRQRIVDLNREWELHNRTCKVNQEGKNSNDNHSKDLNLTAEAYDLIGHELLSIKMREAQIDCDNKILSQKLMDSESQKHILHNQIKRQDDELQRIRHELEESHIRENELNAQLHDIKNQMHDEELRVNMIISFYLIIYFCTFHQKKKTNNNFI